eukprot:9208832-Alexandrium_andersonii.AAC.1
MSRRACEHRLTNLPLRGYYCHPLARTLWGREAAIRRLGPWCLGGALRPRLVIQTSMRWLLGLRLG